MVTPFKGIPQGRVALTQTALDNSHSADQTCTPHSLHHTVFSSSVDTFGGEASVL